MRLHFDSHVYTGCWLWLSLSVSSVCWTELLSRVPQQLWTRIPGSRAQHWDSKFPYWLPTAQPICAINCGVTKLEEKVMEARPKQCSLGNRADIVINIIKNEGIRWWYIQIPWMTFIWIFTLFLLAKNPTPECCLLHSRLLTVV